MKKTYIYIILIVLLVGGLFAWSWYLDPARTEKSQWAAHDIDCTAMEGQVQHFHPHLRIIVDGQEETIPANIGITNRCFGEIHTHDTTGVIHVESPYATKTFVLNQFFYVWGTSINREGYNLTATLDGNPLLDPANLKLADRQDIVLTYTKATTENPIKPQ